MCMAAGCAQLATIGWQRWGTAEEIARYHASGDLPPSETSCLIPVEACDDHAIAEDLRSLVHDSTCSAPPVHDCSVGA